MSPITIKQIAFNDILPIWQHQLWPNRISAIEPVSAIDIESNIDIKILDYTSTAHYFGAFSGSNLAGVISGHLTTPNQCRLRGLFVDETYRGYGISKLLIETEIEKAKSLGCTQIWALIRTKNLGLFQKFAFQKKLETDKYEFGPHFIIEKILN